jgi:hypothetical protein
LRLVNKVMGNKAPIIKFFILAGDYQASDAFEPYQKVYREIIEKRFGGKDYGIFFKNGLDSIPS